MTVVCCEPGNYRTKTRKGEREGKENARLKYKENPVLYGSGVLQAVFHFTHTQQSVVQRKESQLAGSPGLSLPLRRKLGRAEFGSCKSGQD